ncbi:anti sigma factor [Rhodococcus triatomae BKS 15-14]|nr:anti sigma factor [Rhodococcus triatomae BKS 15-14]
MGVKPVPVTLSVPAQHSQLPVIRLLTEMVAMQAGCTLDQSADLKLAVDQVCTLLIDAAAPDTEIACRYQAVDDEFRVALEAHTITQWRPAPGSLERRILESLTDTLAIRDEPAGSEQSSRSTVLLSIGKPV